MSKEIIRPEQFSKADTLPVDEILQLNEQQQQELADLYKGIVSQFKQGSLVKGTILRADSDGVLVDINYKSNGLIPRYEFAGHELNKLKAGDEIEVILDELENIDGNVTLSYEKAKELKAWDEVTKLFEENKPVEGTVAHKVKGGLSVDIGIPAFLPGSQIDLQKVSDFDQFVGQTIIASIIKLNKKRGNVIISRRKYLSDQRAETRKKILDTLENNQVIQGQVKNITNYGAFIDIGGVDGLLHITDMTWGRINHPSELLKIGTTVTVKILSFDKDNTKISLGMKQLTDNPWEKLSETIQPGSKIKGEISNITDYGLFIEVQENIEGLIHISEISWTDRITNLSDKYKIGDEIEPLVLSLDKDNRRMSLSIKQLEKNPWEAISEQFKPGQKITGPITNITDFGIFIELIPGVDGLAHISDLSWTEHIEHPAAKYKKGDPIEAIVLALDVKNKKVALGIKQLTPDPWDTIEEEYPVGKIIEGEVTKITNFGAFIKLPIGIEGLVHISELSDKAVDKVEDVLKIGEKKQFRVINVSREERKLGLSLKLEGKKAAKKEPSAKAEKSTARKKTATYEKKTEPSSTTKNKSMLQIELEKHTARQQEQQSKKTTRSKTKETASPDEKTTKE